MHVLDGKIRRGRKNNKNMNDFDQYFLTVKKWIVKISLSPDKDELKKAFWAGYRYCEELEEMRKKSENHDSMNIFKDIFKKG